ncbi:MAG TPA: NrfD/PsrC family molybdoenzyme membrane anchor subunit [Actinomycetota bacterium]|nr:NrfD/PsrC family molybdoenzyme membrane anchor subunit [Actinomycetota bacterium]
MAARLERLPFGVGHTSGRWKLWMAVLAAIAILGWYGWYLELSRGMIVTGLRNIGPMGGATWGMDVAFIVYFVGVSFAGITVAALVRLADVKALRPIARMAEALTVVSLVLTVFAIMYDLGQPLRGIVNLFRYARPQSPFFGTFTLVISGYLFASLVYLYLGGRRDAARCAEVPGRLQRFYQLWAAGYGDTREEQERRSRASFWLAIAIVPLLVVAHSTLGFVFGLQVGRPGWYSALQAPSFVLLAGVSGVGMLIVIAAVVRRTVAGTDRLDDGVFRWLGNALMILLLAYLYFMVVELLTSIYTGAEREREVTEALLSGRYAPIYWAAVALLVIPLAFLIMRYFRRGAGLTTLVASGVMVNLSAMAKRFLIVVPSQTHGTLLPYQPGSYTPTWVEWAEMAGLIAFGALLLAVFAKLFPIMPVEGSES